MKCLTLEKYKHLIAILIISILFIFPTGLVATENAAIKKIIVIKNSFGSGVAQVGQKIYEDSSLLVPSAIAIDSRSNIFIADPVNLRIQEYDNRGKYVNSIKFNIKKEGYGLYIDDITTDGNDNLYVASRHEMKIDKYNSEGKLMQSINLGDKDIRWRQKEGWVKGSIQIRRIAVDAFGNIYVQGSDELVKFNKQGSLTKRWTIISRTRSPIFLLDRAGNLYLIKDGKAVEKYDNEGNLLTVNSCGYLASSMEGAYCYLPVFIDDSGFLYKYKFEDNNNIMETIKMSNDGKETDSFRIPLPLVYTNTVKFSHAGNLYIFDHSGSKFWIEKYKWH